MGKIQTSLTGVVIIFLIIGSCLTLFITKYGEAEGNSIYVNVAYYFPDSDGSADHPYNSIQYAIDIAEEGDIIYVFGGEYNESLTINKRLSLVGSIDNGNTIINKKQSRNNYLVHISADQVTFESFNVTDSTDNNRVALIYVTSSYFNLQTCNITESDTWGIYFNSVGDSTIGSNLLNNTRGIYSYHSNNNVFSNNDFNNSGRASDDAAIRMKYSDNNIVYGNSFNNNNYAIYAQYCDNNNITFNTIDNNTFHGIKLFGGNSNTVRDNFINYSANGVDLASSDNNIIGNRFDHNEIGINLAASNCQIKSNYIDFSDQWGIYTSSASNNNIIYLNYFNNNNFHARESGNNQWHYGSKGNYWDDYNEVDKDLDGIGDVKYLISVGGQDLYPIGKFLKSPEKPTDPSPEDGEDKVGLYVTLKVTVTDPDSEKLDVFFYKASDDTLYGQNHDVPSGEEASCTFSLPFETTFLWYAIASDGKLENRSDIWIFTTRQIPPTNKKPVADPGGPYYAVVGEEITFYGTGSNDTDGTIDFYRWNFGDGSSEILAVSPNHTYTDPGTYTITLTVVDNDGRSDTEQTTTMITTSPITNYPPNSDPGGPYLGEIDESITFIGNGSSDTDGTIMVYNWSFGDGTYSAGILASHTYSIDGTYLLELTVTDDDGASHKSSVVVTINPKSGIPGFELILVTFAILVIFLYKRRIN